MKSTFNPQRLAAIALLLFVQPVTAQSFTPGAPCAECGVTGGSVISDDFGDVTCDLSPRQIWNEGSPSVQFTLDLLVLDRSDVDSSPLLFDTVTAQPLFNTGDLIREAEPGVRMGMIIFDDQCGRDFELSFMQTNRFGHGQTVTSANPITFPFFGGAPANPASSYTLELESGLKSFEMNIRQRYGSRVSLIAGLRYWELSEYFNVHDTGGGTGFFSTADNDLYGFQIGADVQWLRIRRSVLFTTIKGGVYYNNADVQARAAAGALPLEFIDDEDEVAFAGELTAGLLIPMGPQADFRIGYQGYLLDGVGCAPNQSRTYDIFTGSGTLDKSTVYYHGGFIGIDLFF
ncbi:MAG: hypothetical protein KDA92_12230 [Planctomycetales bacterium]|nr:hypothetical protein [Planctomycetales bacterium]